MVKQTLQRTYQNPGTWKTLQPHEIWPFSQSWCYNLDSLLNMSSIPWPGCWARAATAQRKPDGWCFPTRAALCFSKAISLAELRGLLQIDWLLRRPLTDPATFSPQQPGERRRSNVTPSSGCWKPPGTAETSSSVTLQPKPFGFPHFDHLSCSSILFEQ